MLLTKKENQVGSLFCFKFTTVSYFEKHYPLVLMCRGLTLSVVLLLLSLLAEAQRSTGFYLAVTCGKESTRVQESIGDRTACLADSAVIGISGIQFIGPLKHDGHKLHFELKLNRQAYRILRTIADQILDPSLALVVRDEVFVILELTEIKATNTYHFYGDAIHKRAIEQFYANLLEDWKH